MRRTTESEKTPPDSPGRLVLTGEGLAWLSAALLLGVVGWVKSINLVLLLAYLMVALVFLNGLFARRQVRRIVATRHPNPVVHAGEDTTVRVTASNIGSRPTTVSVEDSAGDSASSWLVYQLAPGGTTACTARMMFPIRGRFTSALLVSSGVPLGLVRCDRTIPGAELVVLPAVGVAEANGMRQWILRQAGGDGRVRKVLRRATTDQTDVRGVRPYRPGDPIRGIHWRSSARRGELMVREYDAAPSPELVLVIEPWLPNNPSKEHESNLEAALSLAVTIVESWTRAYGTRVTVGVAGNEESVHIVGATDSGIREALVPLADVKGTNVFPPFAAGVFDRSLQRAACVVVSSRRKSQYAAALTRSTGRLFLTLSASDRLPWYQPPVMQVQESASRSNKLT